MPCDGVVERKPESNIAKWQKPSWSNGMYGHGAYQQGSQSVSSVSAFSLSFFWHLTYRGYHPFTSVSGLGFL